MSLIDAAELGHIGKQGRGSDGAHARNADKDVVPPGQNGVRINGPCNGSIERCKLCIDLAQTIVSMALEQIQVQNLESVQGRGAIPHQASPCCHELGQFQLSITADGAGDWLKERTELGQELGVNPVGLGESAGGLGKASCLTKIGFDERQASRVQVFLELAMVRTRGFEHHARGPSPAKPAQQRCVTLAIVHYARHLPGGVDGCIEMAFRNIGPDRDRQIRLFGLGKRLGSSFPCPMLVIRGIAPGYPFRAQGKEGTIIL